MKRLAWSKDNEDMRWQMNSWNPRRLEMLEPKYASA